VSELHSFEGSGWTLLVDPGRGAKITSLRDRHGNEWLAQAAGAAASPTPERAFVDAEMAGWDECAPSILACESAGGEVPDHGSLWNRPFDVDDDLLSAVDERLGFELSRRISFDADGLLLTYTAKATRPQPFLWAAHPQFVSPPGTKLELPCHLTRLVDVTSGSPVEVDRDELVAGAADLQQGGSRKFYVHPDDTAAHALLRRPDGDALVMSWSDECRYLGIWLDHAHYSREPVLALEPATGYFDSVAYAERAGRIAWLEPDRPLTWWVRLSAPNTTAYAPTRLTGHL
jgi:galactose mutarotase-like enzyme